MSFGLVSVFQLAYLKAELEDLGLSGLQVVPTTLQPLQAQPIRRGGITTIYPLIKHKKKSGTKCPDFCCF
ncbi:hypothetical protein DA798_11835 [Lactobacillus sp. PFC-70]|nr:hypothetical protein DA798_11835 [Lactobacillus sp. PFC-70]